MTKDVLLLGHHLRMQPRVSKPSWRPNPCEVRVNLGLQEQYTSIEMNLGDTGFSRLEAGNFWPASIIGGQASARLAPKCPPRLLLNGGGCPNVTCPPPLMLLNGGKRLYAPVSIIRLTEVGNVTRPPPLRAH
jgi:hypothetical protein